MTRRSAQTYCLFDFFLAHRKHTQITAADDKQMGRGGGVASANMIAGNR